MAKVTGIGGVFFKAKGDAKALSEWYAKHLGLTLEPWGGALLKWPHDPAPDEGGVTVWNLAGPDSQWFDGAFMINYRVDDLRALVSQLERDGVPLAKGPESHENGLFAWLVDPDGNRVELWQPIAGA